MPAPTPRRLITRAQLYDWFGVSEWWVNDRLENDPGFPVIDLARPGAKQRSLRFDVDAVAKHFGFSVPPHETAEQPAA